MTYNDYKGNSILHKEPDDKVILVYEVSPMLHSESYDSVVIRSWQELNEYIRNCFDIWLERYTDEQLKDGVNLNVKLIEMTKREYDAATEE